MAKSLIETNPYLKDPAKRIEALARNIESSSAIEGICVKRDATNGHFFTQPNIHKAKAKPAKTSR